ncbi:MAG: MoaD/ThiS family protein [Methanomicrobium sp.]|nr:MoaD/ThiS family protein [Methanomicrobium sp.]
MIKTEILIFARFKETFGEKRTISFSDDDNPTLLGALKKLCEDTKGGYEILFDSEGELFEGVLLMLNKKRILGEDAEDMIISDGDEIVLYPPVSGG